MFMSVPFLRSFPGNEAHKLLLGCQKGVFWVGAKKVMLKKFMCFFGPLGKMTAKSFTQPREARDLISKIRSCTVRSDLKNKQKIAEKKVYVEKVHVLVLSPNGLGADSI